LIASICPLVSLPLNALGILELPTMFHNATQSAAIPCNNAKQASDSVGALSATTDTKSLVLAMDLPSTPLIATPSHPVFFLRMPHEHSGLRVRTFHSAMRMASTLQNNAKGARVTAGVSLMMVLRSLEHVPRPIRPAWIVLLCPSVCLPLIMLVNLVLLAVTFLNVQILGNILLSNAIQNPTHAGALTLRARKSPELDVELQSARLIAILFPNAFWLLSTAPSLEVTMCHNAIIVGRTLLNNVLAPLALAGVCFHRGTRLKTHAESLAIHRLIAKRCPHALQLLVQPVQVGSRIHTFHSVMAMDRLCPLNAMAILGIAGVWTSLAKKSLDLVALQLKKFPLVL